MLVSWKVIMQHALSSIFLLISFHLVVELIPLTFQFKIFQLLFMKNNIGGSIGSYYEKHNMNNQNDW